MRIGIFGGTFDPPHIGHLILADECLHQLKLDKVLWVLTSVPPHKLDQNICPLEQRLALVEAEIAGRGDFQLSRVDIDRPDPHYAVDTVRILRKQHPNAGLIYLMGGDSLHDLPKWHTPADFVLACDEIGVMHRPGDSVDLQNLEQTLPGIGDKVRWIDAPLLEIASHQIRTRIKTGSPYQYYLQDKVYRLICDNHWYQ